jgi:4-hydroxythreonine-4-phosphate dehydrogenase
MRNPSSRIPVVITLGDPRGIGPEVVFKALGVREVTSRITPIVVGTPDVVSRARRLLKSNTPVVSVSGSEIERPGTGRGVYVISPPGLRNQRAGQHGARISGRISLACVEEGVRLCKVGHAAALVTAPISKASLKAAGSPHVGHTEMLRDLCRVRSTAMMFAWGSRRISLATTHVPVSAVGKTLTKVRIETTILLTERALRLLFRVTAPRIAVLSLNPHSGEGGLLGREEKLVIEPAITDCLARGLDVHGPFAADSFFAREGWKAFDAIVAMYHDQGLIPAKVLGGEKAVNVTLGLPFVRTSPGHGTAEDIAWKGVADPAGVASAILLAAKLARNAGPSLTWELH